MKEFILEEEMKRVMNVKTRNNLLEVISSYNNKNYRAAVVTLYTTVIYDLMSKLLQLKEIYQDRNAKNILEEIKNKQTKFPTNPVWETYLIEEACEKLHLMTAVEKEELLWIKKERNFAAHPIITFNGVDEIELKDITKESAADLIRKAFEIVFTKDALLGRDISEEIARDLIDYFKRVGNQGLQNYLKQRYFLRMTQDRKEKLFKNLWSYVFIINDDECRKNRESLFYGLLYLTMENKNQYLDLISQEKDRYYNKIKLETYSDFVKSMGIDYDCLHTFNKQSRILHFLYFVNLVPEIVETFNSYINGIILTAIDIIYLTDDVTQKTLYQVGIEKKELFQSQIRIEAENILYKSDLKQHFNIIDNMIDNYSIRKNYDFRDNVYDVLNAQNIKIMLHQAEYKGWIKNLVDCIIEFCIYANNYMQADCVIEYITVIQEYMARRDYMKLLIGMNHNNQYNSNRNINEIITQIKILYNNKEHKDLFSVEKEKLILTNIEVNLIGKYKLHDIFEQIEVNASEYSVTNLITTLQHLVMSRDSTELLAKKSSDYPKIENALMDINKLGFKDFNIKLFQDFFVH